MLQWREYYINTVKWQFILTIDRCNNKFTQMKSSNENDIHRPINLLFVCSRYALLDRMYLHLWHRELQLQEMRRIKPRVWSRNWRFWLVPYEKIERALLACSNKHSFEVFCLEKEYPTMRPYSLESDSDERLEILTTTILKCSKWLERIFGSLV